MSVRKIIFYSDTRVFSGHEIQGVYALEAFAAAPEWQPVAFIDADNPRFVEKLQAIEGLELAFNERSGVVGQSLRNRFAGRAISRLGARFRAQEPDLVVVLQGDIERGSFGVLAAKRAGIPCISYIPNPHSLEMMKARGGQVRDLFNRSLYNLPDRFIVVSECHEDLLRAQGCTRPVDVVYNGMDASGLLNTNGYRVEGLPADKLILGHVGRVEFNQKRQDFIVRHLPEMIDRVHFLQVGDGSDRNALQTLVADLNLGDHVTMIPFLEPAQIYASMDWLVLPSGYEGLPLVMMEAILCGVPVLAQDRDGMRDMLPPAWRFDDDTYVETCLRNFDTDVSDDLARLKLRVETDMTVAAFQRNFMDACVRVTG